MWGNLMSVCEMSSAVRLPLAMALLCLGSATLAATPNDKAIAAPVSTAPAISAATESPGLPDCPKKPNCVSSLASEPQRRVEPLAAGSDADSARHHLITVLDSLPRVTWQSPSARHIDAEFTSRLLRFVDDVNFIIRDDGLIEVRSASRIGYSDLGANRKRVEMLRNALQQAQPSTGGAPD